MATNNHSNVLALPTAAARKVKQPNNTRRHRAEVAKLSQHPAEYMTPHQRRAQATAETLMDMQRSVPLLIATAIFQTLEPRQRGSIMAYAAMLDAGDLGRQASAWLGLLTTDFGMSASVKFEMDKIAKERGQ